VAVQLNGVDRDCLQNADKTDAVELYYKLLSSGHSASEILEASNSIQSKAGHGDAAAAAYPRAKPDGAPTDIAAEGTPAKGAQARTQGIPGVSASQGANDGSTETRPVTEGAQLNRRASDDGEQLRDHLSSSEPYILGPVAAPTSTSRDATLRRNDLDQVRPGRFPGTVRRIASRVIYTAVVASASVIGFAIVDGDRYIQPIIARMLSDISSGIETTAIPNAATGRAEAVEKTSNSTMQIADTDPSPAPEPLRPAERVAAEVQAMISAALSQANAPHELEAGRQQDATPVSASTAATLATAMLREAPAAAAMKADAAGSTELSQTHATGPGATATPGPALTKALKSGPEAQDTSSAAAAETEHRIDGDRGGAQATSLAEIARAEQPDAASSPAPETAAVAAAPRIAEITPDEPRFKTMGADALVARGDAFFAAGDLASARLFYEHSVAAGNGIAALRLGSTYDRDFLARVHIGRIQGDAAIASYWYRRARDLGNRDAEVLLKRMENTAR